MRPFQSIQPSFRSRPVTQSASTRLFRDSLAAQQHELSSIAEWLEVVANGLRSDLQEQDEAVVQGKVGDEQADSIKGSMDRRGATLDKCRQVEEMVFQVNALHKEFNALKKEFGESSEAYAAALERNHPEEDRGSLFRQHSTSSRSMDEWTATWERLKSRLEDFLPPETDNASSTADAAAGSEPAAAAGIVTATAGMNARVEHVESNPGRDFFKEPFPSTEEAQIEHVVGLQAQIQMVKSEVTRLNGHMKVLLGSLKGDGELSATASEEIARLYRQSMTRYLDCKTKADEYPKAYLKYINAHQDKLHFAAFGEITGIDLVLERIRAATTEFEARDIAAKFHEALKQLKQELENFSERMEIPLNGVHGGNRFYNCIQVVPKPFRPELFDHQVEKVFVLLVMHKKCIDGVRKITEIQKSLPVEAQTPVRFPWKSMSSDTISQLVEFEREAAKMREQSFSERLPRQQMQLTKQHADLMERREKLFDRQLLAQERRFVDFDQINAAIDAIVRDTDKDELTRFAMQSLKTLHEADWLIHAPRVAVLVFQRIKDAYRDIEVQARRAAATPASNVVAVRSAKVPGRAGGQKKVARSGGRSGTGPGLTHANRNEIRGSKRAGAIDPIFSVGDVFPATVEVGSDELLKADWVAVGAPPTWTRYTSSGGAEMHLEDTNRTLKSRASNLWNWNQRGMAGNETHVLTDSDCLALVDWIMSHSAIDRPDHERLFSHFTILCSPGTGSHAGGFQLKIINLDPGVPSVPTGEFDEFKRQMKRPTFHLKVASDPGTVQRIKEGLTARGFPDVH